MNKLVYLHIGYPKTATTFMQQEYFPAMEEIHYINQLELWETGFLGIIFDDLFSSNDHKYISILRTWKAAAGEKKLFISYEGFVGNLFWGLKNFPLICQRLKKTGFDFKILLSIRRQEKIADSLYIQYVHQGGALSFDNFIKLPTKYPLHLALNVFDYNAIYDKLNFEFGQGNVYVLPYESIKYKEYLIDYLTNYFNQEVKLKTSQFNEHNVSLSGNNLKLLRFLNRFLSSWVSTNGIFPSSILNTTKVKNFLQKINKGKNRNPYFIHNIHCQSFVPFYEASNEKLQVKIGIPLKEKYNYL
tara:strand:+ start:109194 stop:110096 length:903 start_codon:yes stop_codon:yes gene_type:complete